MICGTFRCGASVTHVANLEENSPKLRCCDWSAMRWKVAASQKLVVPPLPSRTSYPSGSEKSARSPSRTSATLLRTVAWRCDVPMYVVPSATRALSCSGRTFDGPEPNRPSRGSSSAGIFRVSVELIDLFLRILNGAPDEFESESPSRRLGPQCDLGRGRESQGPQGRRRAGYRL